MSGALSHEDKMRAVIRLGMEMRGAQRKYFRTRDQADLRLSKRLEREYDAAAEAVFGPAAPAKKPQGELL